jgi:hypothetical protein
MLATISFKDKIFHLCTREHIKLYTFTSTQNIQEKSFGTQKMVQSLRGRTYQKKLATSKLNFFNHLDMSEILANIFHIEDGKLKLM